MNCLVVHAHPSQESFNSALRSVVVDILTALGHRVDVIDLYGIDYQPCLTADEHVNYLELAASGPDGIVASHMALLAETDVLIFVYPTWWSGLPAILKGWLERTMLPGFAFELASSDSSAKKSSSALKVQPRLTHVSHLFGITTYGSGWPEVRLLGDGGRRTVARAIRALCGTRTKTTWLPMYRLDGSSDAERQAFLDKVAATLTSALPRDAR